MGHDHAHRPGAGNGGEDTKFGKFLRVLGLQRVLSDERGGILLTFALVFPVLLLILGSSIDYGYMYVRKTSLQASADAAALAGAKELVLANAEQSVIQALAQSTVMANLGNNAKGAVVDTKVSFGDRSVTVRVTQTPAMYIMDGIAGVKNSNITANATAGVAGEMPICMLILERWRQDALAVNNAARITGNDCAIYSNSISTKGVTAKNGSLLQSQLTCSAGGFTGDPESYKPLPMVDCPKIEDPLAFRKPPPEGPCLHEDLSISGGTQTLNPGTYCGGLTIKSKADVTLSPGVYIIKDGPLLIHGSARIKGENVGFYLTGSKAMFEMLSNTTVALSAPMDGPMAGILFFEDRRNKAHVHKIKSNDARSFIGTVYLPTGSLTIDASKPVFDQSAYTVIIAKSLDMFSGPNLVLNSNYGDSDVPLPSELDAASTPGEEVRLIH